MTKVMILIQDSVKSLREILVQETIRRIYFLKPLEEAGYIPMDYWLPRRHSHYPGIQKEALFRKKHLSVPTDQLINQLNLY